MSAKIKLPLPRTSAEQIRTHAHSPGMSERQAKGEKDNEDLQLVDKLVASGLGVSAFCVTPTLRMCYTKKPLLRVLRQCYECGMHVPHHHTFRCCRWHCSDSSPLLTATSPFGRAGHGSTGLQIHGKAVCPRGHA